MFVILEGQPSHIVVISGSAGGIRLIIFIKARLSKEMRALGRDTRSHLTMSLVGHGLLIAVNLRCRLSRDSKRPTLFGTSAGKEGLIDMNSIVINALTAGLLVLQSGSQKTRSWECRCSTILSMSRLRGTRLCSGWRHKRPRRASTCSPPLPPCP